tara:strand:- start:125 stop:478 length:354 start_codon:yes stop_codon:yes gene_type:complete
MLLPDVPYLDGVAALYWLGKPLPLCYSETSVKRCRQEEVIMRLEELIAKVSRLPSFRQQEVIDFVAFLEQRYGDTPDNVHADWSEHQFQAMSMDQAMRGLEDEPELYSEDDLKERWQ